MTSGVRTPEVKDHWVKQVDGTWISTHPKYVGMRIEKINQQCYLLCQENMDPVKRMTLRDIKETAWLEANWTSPQVREWV